MLGEVVTWHVVGNRYQCPNHSSLILQGPHRLTSPLTDCPPPDQRLCRQEGAGPLISQSKSFSLLKKARPPFPLE